MPPPAVHIEEGQAVTVQLFTAFEAPALDPADDFGDDLEETGACDPFEESPTADPTPETIPQNDAALAETSPSDTAPDIKDAIWDELSDDPLEPSDDDFDPFADMDEPILATPIEDTSEDLDPEMSTLDQDDIAETSSLDAVPNITDTSWDDLPEDPHEPLDDDFDPFADMDEPILAAPLEDTSEDLDPEMSTLDQDDIAETSPLDAAPNITDGSWDDPSDEPSDSLDVDDFDPFEQSATPTTDTSEEDPLEAMADHETDVVTEVPSSPSSNDMEIEETLAPNVDLDADHAPAAIAAALDTSEPATSPAPLTETPDHMPQTAVHPKPSTAAPLVDRASKIKTLVKKPSRFKSLQAVLERSIDRDAPSDT